MSALFLNGQPKTANTSDVYSTEEVRIGTYLGKPLYRKTFPNVNVSRNYRVMVDASINNSSVKLVDAYGNLSADGSQFVYPVVYASQNLFTRVYVENSGLYFENYYNTALNFTITVEYTKNTD